MANKQARYIDGFVLVVPKDKIEAYQKMASEGAALWMKYGALNYKECLLDNNNPDLNEHQTLPFTQLVQAKSDETVWFSYIEYESKQHRDEVNAKVMADSAMSSENADQMENMPFDMKRMAVGGFEVIVSS